MKAGRRIALASFALAVLIVAVVVWRSDKPRVAAPVPSVVAVGTPPPAPLLSGDSIPLARLADADIDPHQKIRRVYSLVQNYVTVMKHRGGRPPATNAEFTAALTGRNPLRVVFLPANNPAISDRGELLDAWQTPYFFHALAADSIEVVSAGPDRVPFNGDDLIFPAGRRPHSLAPSRSAR